MAFILLNSGLLKQLPVHTVELEQKVLIERKRDLTQANLVKHHERNQILLLFSTMVNHVHVDDVVFYYNIVALF